MEDHNNNVNDDGDDDVLLRCQATATRRDKNLRATRSPADDSTVVHGENRRRHSDVTLTSLIADHDSDACRDSTESGSAVIGCGRERAEGMLSSLVNRISLRTV